MRSFFGTQAPNKLFSRIYFLIIILNLPALAQNLLNNPESLVYDQVYNRYLVSNCGDGKIVQINNSGEQSYFNTQLSYTFGMVIVEDNVFIVSNSGNYQGIAGLLLSTGEIVFHVEIPAKKLLNDIASDGNGNLFITDCEADKIYKVSISDESYTTLVDSGLGYPNGILFDEFNNRLLVLNCLLPRYPIKAIDMIDFSQTTVVETGLNSIDGLTIDNNGFFYFSSWSTDKVYRYDPDFTIPRDIVSYGHTDPADIFFNKQDNVLAVPNYTSNKIDFIDVVPEYLYPGFDSNIKSGHAPITVQFQNKTLTNQEISFLAWDFNGDGITDSNEEFPEIKFDSPGYYNVLLAITTSQDYKTIEKAEFIKVFDGKSAIRFDGMRSNAQIPANSNLNLTDSFSIETIIKPLNRTVQQYIFDKEAVKIRVVGKVFGAAKDSTVSVHLKLNDETLVKLAAESGSIKLNEWQHIALTYNSSANDFRMYINGIEKEIFLEGTNELSGSLFNNTNTPIFLGNSQTLLDGFDGIIDGLRIWNDVRTQSEILESIPVELQGNEENLIGYWKMDEDNGQELLDLSGSRNNGLVTSAWYVQGTDPNLLTEVTDDYSALIKPDNFELVRNYPNPFNPTTIINYNLKEACFVTLSISDILGREITTLVSKKHNPGNYRVSFDASEFSSGVYLYKLTAGKYVDTKKMILLR